MWITPYFKQINDLNHTRDILQGLLAEGNLSEMDSILEEFIKRQGWSMWAAELKFALTQQIGGNEATRTLSANLQDISKNRAGGLFAQIFSERNEEGFSFDSFQTKCENSLSRFKHGWLSSYLPYRATSFIVDPERNFPIILSCEITSSLFDYYEVVIELLQHIRSNPQLINYKKQGASLLDSLISSGIQDGRLGKIAVGLHDSIDSIAFVETDSQPSLKALHKRLVSFQSVSPDSSIDNKFLNKVHGAISRCEEGGMTAQDDIDLLLKLGLSLKSLPIGISLAFKAMQCALSLEENTIFPYGLDLSLHELSIEDILSNSDEKIINLFHQDWSGVSEDIRDAFHELRDVIDGKSIDSDLTINIPPALQVWLSRYLSNQNRNEEARVLAARLSEFGGALGRQTKKLLVYIDTSLGNLPEALREASSQLLIDSWYAHELPLKRIFLDNKWKQFQSIDPILVGLVSHYACLSENNASIRFICRMACRAFYTNGHRDNLDDAWSTQTTSESKERLIRFLWDVWTEDNLALVESFRSTQEIRQERIAIFQKLLSWDPAHSQEYSSFIKELTFDETLWRGLKKINETRIFVNEPAITRWAEKELSADFERWRKLRSSSAPVSISDDIVRTYLLDENIDELFKALPKEDATEANAMLFDIMGRLLKKFMTDQTDGLDCYLSLRIRHGSLKGTLFGPLEEEGLLISGPTSEEAFHDRWDHILRLPTQSSQAAIFHLRNFTDRLQAKVKTIIDDKLQIYSSAKPKGAFPSKFDDSRISVLVPLFSEEMSFPFFLSTCYEAFWAMLSPIRVDLAEYFRVEVKSNLQAEFDALVTQLRTDIGQPSLPLEIALLSVATSTQTQCDVVAEWFVSHNEAEKESYQLTSAINIAKTATENVYRSFSVDIASDSNIDGALQLTASGLAVLTDCLYVIFENAWKHSGLYQWLGDLHLSAEFDKEKKLLILETCNALSAEVSEALRDGKLINLRETYLVKIPIHLAPKEGGSGFAKLARVTSAVDRSVCEKPLDFGINEQGNWFVKVAIPLYERDGAFDAYE